MQLHQYARVTTAAAHSMAVDACVQIACRKAIFQLSNMLLACPIASSRSCLEVLFVCAVGVWCVACSWRRMLLDSNSSSIAV
jgi:hypothetical protein